MESILSLYSQSWPTAKSIEAGQLQSSVYSFSGIPYWVLDKATQHTLGEWVNLGTSVCQQSPIFSASDCHTLYYLHQETLFTLHYTILASQVVWNKKKLKSIPHGQSYWWPVKFLEVAWSTRDIVWASLSPFPATFRYVGNEQLQFA